MKVRIAAIDIGTNSTRLLIAEIVNGGLVELERASQVTRLGAGVDTTGRLSSEATDRVFKTLDSYLEKIQACGCQKQRAVLTSAARDASNGEEFAKAIEHRYGIESRILDGDEEAQLTFAGATHSRPPGEQVLVADIGGGSTELVVGETGEQPQFHVSVQSGVVRQTERHLPSDPPRTSELAELSSEVRELIENALPNKKELKPARMIAVAGTATACAAIDQRLEPYDPDKVHGYELSRERVAKILQQLAELPLRDRKNLPGLHPDRAQTAVAGVAILKEVMEIFQFKTVEVSNHDILHGTMLELMPHQATFAA